MPGPCERLSWDSEHFGFEVARVRGSLLDPASAAEIDRWCLERGVRCLYLLADAEDPETAQVASRHGYVVVDVRLTMRHELGGLGDQPWDRAGRASFREGTEDDLEQLGRLAGSSHHTTRFYFDRGFPRERSDRLYSRAVERAVADPARRLLVGELDGEPAGYQAIRLPREGVGDLELVAVDERHRGRGLGAELISAALRYLRERGAGEARTWLQARNVPAVRVHERIGFLADRTEIWHHKWFEAPEGG